MVVKNFRQIRKVFAVDAGIIAGSGGRTSMQLLETNWGLGSDPQYLEIFTFFSKITHFYTYLDSCCMKTCS